MADTLVERVRGRPRHPTCRSRCRSSSPTAPSWPGMTPRARAGLRAGAGRLGRALLGHGLDDPETVLSESARARTRRLGTGATTRAATGRSSARATCGAGVAPTAVHPPDERDARGDGEHPSLFRRVFAGSSSPATAPAARRGATRRSRRPTTCGHTPTAAPPPRPTARASAGAATSSRRSPAGRPTCSLRGPRRHPTGSASRHRPATPTSRWRPHSSRRDPSCRRRLGRQRPVLDEDPAPTAVVIEIYRPTAVDLEWTAWPPRARADARTRPRRSCR